MDTMPPPGRQISRQVTQQLASVDELGGRRRDPSLTSVPSMQRDLTALPSLLDLSREGTVLLPTSEGLLEEGDALEAAFQGLPSVEAWHSGVDGSGSFMNTMLDLLTEHSRLSRGNSALELGGAFSFISAQSGVQGSRTTVPLSPPVLWSLWSSFPGSWRPPSEQQHLHRCVQHDPDGHRG